MLGEVCGPCEGLLAAVALEGFVASVTSSMDHQCSLQSKFSTTGITSEWLLIKVNIGMIFQILLRGEFP